MNRACETLLNHAAELTEELATEIRNVARSGRVSSIQTYVDARIPLIQEYLKAVEKLET